MPEYVANYQINENTMALSPAFHPEYDTIVYEPGRILYVKQLAFKLIIQACLEGGASYDGRRNAVMYHTGVMRKVPIPIDTGKVIYTFPTNCPNHFTCHWIFYSHVHSIKPNLSKANAKSIIIFKDGRELLMNESCYQLEKQMHRTATCILKFGSIDYFRK